MTDVKELQKANSGIETSADGTTYIPSSRRADGSTRKEIRVRPGYRPPEDVATYKNRSAEAWKNRGSGGVPGAESPVSPSASVEVKSKNAKRREAARKKAQETDSADGEIVSAMGKHGITDQEEAKARWRDPDNLTSSQTAAEDEEVERQKKIRNQLKKLNAIHELKSKRAKGEKLSHDQLAKLGKEPELLRDLRKLKYEGPELKESAPSEEASADAATEGNDLG